MTLLDKKTEQDQQPQERIDLDEYVALKRELDELEKAQGIQKEGKISRMISNFFEKSESKPKIKISKKKHLWTGAYPETHGIRKYEKPVIKIDTLFDALIRAGKTCAIIADTNCSMGKIFLERDMDYFLFETIAEINEKAAELIAQDEYDFIAVYNGNYDSTMHKTGPESAESIAQLKDNVASFDRLVRMVKECWKSHNTLYAFAMDHGCHEIDGSCGAHGLDMPEDLNILHLYGLAPKSV